MNSMLTQNKQQLRAPYPIWQPMSQGAYPPSGRYEQMISEPQYFVDNQYVQPIMQIPQPQVPQWHNMNTQDMSLRVPSYPNRHSTYAYPSLDYYEPQPPNIPPFPSNNMYGASDQYGMQMHFMQNAPFQPVRSDIGRRYPNPSYMHNGYPHMNH